MALISIKRNIDLQPGLNAPAIFNCSQGDKGTTMMLGLMNGGNDYTVPSGITITIRGSRSNGAVFTPVSATSSGSTVSFTLTEEMTDTAGPTLCEAVLEQGNNVLGTANFIINVEGSPMGADVPPVFTDAAWTWMLGKLTTETVPALGDDVISSIQGKVDKSQGSTNAKKFLRVNTSGNVSLASTDKTLSVADQIADAKETGDQIRALDAEIDGVATTLGGSISTLNGITTDLQSSKLNKNQGTSNAGKIMVVDSSGNIVPGDVPITIDDTLSIADAAADAKATGDALALKANESTIAPEFSDQNTYTAGSYVYKNGVLYRFSSDHTAGAWTGSDAEIVTVGREVTDLKADLSGNEASTKIVAFTDNYYIKTGGVVTVNLTPVSDNTARYAIVDCAAGDTFNVSCKTYTAAKAWCFIDSSNKVLTSSSGTGVITETVTAPAGSVKAIFNDDKNSSGGVTKVIPANPGVLANIAELQEQSADILNRIYNPIGYTDSKTDSLTINNDGSINATTGEVSASETFDYTDYVEIDSYTFDKLGYSRIVSSKSLVSGMAFYDTDKTYLSGQKAKTGSFLGHEYTIIDVPRKAKYARFSFRKDSPTSISVDLINSGDLQKQITKFGPDTTSPLEFCPVGLYQNEDIEINNLTTSAEVYAAYDALLENDTNATRNTIGYASDSSGEPDENLPIYEYVFPNAVSGSEISKPVKVLLSSGIHGGEKVAVVGLYNFIRSLFSSTNEIASCIRLACEFHVVPLINPYGFNNAQRTNAHGVDLNRNFGVNWGGNADQGSSPYSEPETQALTAWLWDNEDALFFIDCHNHNQIDQGNTTIMYYTASQVPMHRKSWSFTFRRLIRYFISEYSEDISTYYHVIEGNTIPGVANEAYTNVHIDASILETPVGAYATHGRKTTEITGDFILSLLKNYRI